MLVPVREAKVLTLPFRLSEDRPSRRLKFLQSYWDSKRRGTGLPARHDIDPVEMRDHLPWLMLLDVQPDPFDLRCRLLGNELVHWLGRDVTGLWLEEIGLPPDSRRHLVEALRRVATEAKPNYYAGQHPLNRDCYQQFRMLQLPLAGDGSNVDMLLCGVVIA